MAKKNKTSKKHRFKYAQPVVDVPATPSAGPSDKVRAAVVAPPLKSVGPKVTAIRNFSYVTADVRRLTLLLGALVVVELALWYLMSHTDLGTIMYSFFKVR